eukprot:CAMPEP_0169261342 /NCGR_PEP_ID=MMETSP1016-20121227/43041_1 /TAXON_ID=342587 /ORGANISM="Karlodinium micrum, Strain CCMP2283" /LENGTH=141 /DNA_ID=CAMNT_0009343631 /DNA_START=35 /DNA_END=457 /DNA_ORIENTATION=+
MEAVQLEAAKAAVSAAVASGGDKLNALIGIGIIIYMGIMGFQSLIFSFQYSVYSFFAAGVLVIGELPFVVTCGPLQTIASYLTTTVKAYTYGLVSLGGIACFINISWNPLLLVGHLALGYLAYRCWTSAQAGQELGGSKEG